MLKKELRLTTHFRLGTRNSCREDFLCASSRIVPEWMDKHIVCGQTLVVADKLVSVLIDRGVHRRVPALRSHTDILQKGYAVIDGLRQVHINQPVLWIKACVEERDVDDAVGCNSHLWLKLVRSIPQCIIIYPYRQRPRLAMIRGGGEQDISVSGLLI